MLKIQDIEPLQKQISAWRSAGERIAFVPTMGNLHEGHLALVDKARELADRCVVSIFVNPTQFGPNEDFASYARTEEHDCVLLEQRDADLVFMPSIETVYPPGEVSSVSVPTSLATILCGESRPDHFDGVATVVARLFDLVKPDIAVFGEKDYQQLLVIRWLVDAHALAIDIQSVATVREQDGLAMSSRNRYLSKDERQQAAMLHTLLQASCALLRGQGVAMVDIENQASEQLRTAGFEPEYVSIRRQVDLASPQADDVEFVILAAARLGGARLIDNLFCELPGVTAGS